MYEARLDRVIQIKPQFEKPSEKPNYLTGQQDICSCRFGWATDDSDETAISGIFYGNGEKSHIVIRSKKKIDHFETLSAGESFKQTDTIAAGIDFEQNIAWFAKNGKKVGLAQGYSLPKYLMGRKLFPVVGLQNSTVQLNFGKFKMEIPETEGFLTIDRHKNLTLTDFLWRTHPPVNWENLFSEVEPSKAAIPIFTFLTDSDLRNCLCVRKHWNKIIKESYLLQRAKLRCFHSRLSFRDCVLGVGIVIETDGGKNITKVSSQMEYLSADCWRHSGVRKGISGVKYTHFLPIILNDEHGKKTLPELESFLPQTLKILNLSFDPKGIFTLLPKLMNGVVLGLVSEDADPPSKEVIQNALDLYCHLHHMFLYLDKKFSYEITKLVNADILDRLNPVNQTLLQKNQLWDLGTFLLASAVTERFAWKDMRKAALLELFDREVPHYIKRYPELQLIEDEDAPERLRKVMDCNLFARRRTMLQVFFAANVNRASKDVDRQLQGYTRRFGSPDVSIIQPLLDSIKGVYDTDDWGKYFGHLYLVPKNAEFIKNLLIESMGRAKSKQYYIPDESIQRSNEMKKNAQSMPPQFQTQEPAPCESFQDLVEPLAESLRAVEPNPLQLECLPLITRGEEVVVVSPLGTGKHTLAAISVVNTILSLGPGSQIIVVVPDRNQVIHFEEVLADVYVRPQNSRSNKYPIHTKRCVQGYQQPIIDERQNALNIARGHTVWIGQNRQILNYIKDETIKINKIRAVYVMEFDTLFDLNHYAQIEEFFKFVDPSVQVCLFGNTLPDSVNQNVMKVMPNAEQIIVPIERTVKHWFIACIVDEKKKTLLELFCYKCSFTQAIVFVANTHREQAQTYVNEIRQQGRCGTVAFIGSLTTSNDRRQIVSDFNSGKTRILLVEDISLFGLQTKQVQLIIHLDRPTARSPAGRGQHFLDVYDRRLSNVHSHTIHSLIFSTRNIHSFLEAVDAKYDGLRECPPDADKILE